MSFLGKIFPDSKKTEQLPFDEEKAAQICAYFLSRSENQEMPYIKVLKLIYFFEREHLKRTGFPATQDKLFSLKNGPILSNTMDLMREEPDPSEPSFWHECIETVGWNLRLKKDISFDLISEGDAEILDEIIQKFGSWDKWDVVKEAHKLPENIHVDYGREELSYARIFEKFGMTKERAKEQELEITSSAW